MTSPTVTTAQGGTLNITSSGGSVMVSGATVTQADIPASNGVIHAIDTVLDAADQQQHFGYAQHVRQH